MKKVFSINFSLFLILFLFFFAFRVRATTFVINDDCSDTITGHCGEAESGNCPVCGSSTSACCSYASPWHSYDITCKLSVKVIENCTGAYCYPEEVRTAIYTLNIAQDVCSTGDKVNSSSDYLMRAGKCECDRIGGPYKACCNTSTGSLVKYTTTNEDSRGYDEASCPSGTTAIKSPDPSDPYDTYEKASTKCISLCGDKVIGDCGGANGGSFSSAPTTTTALCDKGTPSAVTLTSGKFTWSCKGKCTGGTANCSATKCSPVNGVCGSSNGGTFASMPTANLCSSVGTSTVADSIASDGKFNWNCNGSCNGTIAGCIATKDSPPVLTSFLIKNADGTTVSADANSRNQICQSNFVSSSNPTMAQFTVTYTDNQGGSDVKNIDIQIGSKTFTSSSLTVSGNNATAVFNIARSQILSTSLESISAIGYDVDSALVPSTLVSTGRSFKFWDCKVSVTGTGYDGSATGSSCSNDSFTTTVSNEIVYGLTMNDVSAFDEDQIMTVNSPAYTSGTNSLTWGRDYLFKLSNFPGTDPTIRLNGAASCTSQITLNASVVDPYQDTMSFTADFTSVLDQDSWWQANDGGVISNNKINSRVPVTCTTDNCKISLGSLVTAPLIDNTGRSETESQSWFYGGIDSLNSNAKLADVNKNYSYFYKQYLVKNGIGITAVGNKTIASVNDLGNDTNGIYFIDGNLMINGNLDAGGKFLMIIVNGNITVNQNTTRVDGILVANNIYAVDNGQLVFNGSLFAANTIDFSGRSFATKSDNNVNPVVKVNYKPELIFKIPSKLTKILANWQWGN